MTIDYVIPGTTLLDQLNPTTLDGLPNINASDDCVAESIAEGLHILTGQNYDGDELTDSVYGANYTGFESASAYVGYCSDHGVALVAHNDTQAGLIATIHAMVSAGHPVVVTMPSQWGTAPADPVHPSGSTHVGIAVGVGAGMIRVMNPWHGFFQDQADDWWAARLCYGQVWVMQQKAGVSVSGVPSGWNDNGTDLTAPNGVVVKGEIRRFVLNEVHDPADVPVAPESYPSFVELGNQSLGTGAVQFFRVSGQISAVPVDIANPNGAWRAFRTWNGQEMLALHHALDAAQSTASAAQQAASDAQAHLATAQALIATLQQQIAAAQAAANPALTPAQTAAIQAMAALRAALAAS